MEPREMIERARSLKQSASQRRETTEQNRTIPEATVRDLIELELPKIAVPKTFGGYEMGFDVLGQIVGEVSEGCASTGWLTAVYCGHNWLAACFDERAQAEIYGKRGFTLAPGPLNPAGAKAEAVDGGFLLSGRWPFASGVDHSDWAFVTSYVVPENNDLSEAAVYAFALPRKDYAVADTWQVVGMRGTGSNDIVIEKEVFVPTYRAVQAEGLFGGTGPAQKLHKNPLYRCPFGSAAALVAGATAIGILRDAVDATRERMKTRIHAFSGAKQIDRVSSQIRLAESAVDAECAGLLAETSIRQMMLDAEAGTTTIESRTRRRMHAAYIVNLCKRGIDRVVDSAGANALRDNSRLQRCMRDIHMLATHHFFEIDGSGEIYGKALLGLDIGHAVV